MAATPEQHLRMRKVSSWEGEGVFWREEIVFTTWFLLHPPRSPRARASPGGYFLPLLGQDQQAGRPWPRPQLGVRAAPCLPACPPERPLGSSSGGSWSVTRSVTRRKFPASCGNSECREMLSPGSWRPPPSDDVLHIWKGAGTTRELSPPE